MKHGIIFQGNLSETSSCFMMRNKSDLCPIIFGKAEDFKKVIHGSKTGTYFKVIRYSILNECFYLTPIIYKNKE